MLLAAVAVIALAVEPQPWVGRVRVQSADATGTALWWDPALTPEPPAEDRWLAWDLAAGLTTRAGAWYQRVPGLRLLRPPVTVEPATLDADAATVARRLAARGWPHATVTAHTGADHHGMTEVTFLVEPGEHGEPVPVAEPAPEAGWHLVPLASALGRGATMSVYGGVSGTWRQDAPQPLRADLHLEAGVRAFPDPAADAILGGNVGSWSDLQVTLGRAWVGDVGWFLTAGGRSDVWPAINEVRPFAGAGLRWTTGDVTASVAVRGGSWSSWAWTGQRARYEPWFGGAPLGADQPDFIRAYGFARLDLSAVLDTLDRDVLPRHGVRVAADVTPLAVAGGAPFVRAEVDARAFVPLVGHRWFWAVRARAGAMEWHDPDDRALLGERFFLNAADMKGWGSRRIVPPGYAGDRFDLRIGGDLVTYANTEVRWDLHRDLSLAAFVDVGRVWNEADQIALRRLLWDVGLTASVPSPLGSVRLDVAVPIRRQAIDAYGPVSLQLWLDEPF